VLLVPELVPLVELIVPEDPPPQAASVAINAPQTANRIWSLFMTYLSAVDGRCRSKRLEVPLVDARRTIRQISVTECALPANVNCVTVRPGPQFKSAE
jgi:hypothetical protein